MLKTKTEKSESTFKKIIKTKKTMIYLLIKIDLNRDLNQWFKSTDLNLSTLPVVNLFSECGCRKSVFICSYTCSFESLFLPDLISTLYILVVHCYINQIIDQMWICGPTGAFHQVVSNVILKTTKYYSLASIHQTHAYT